MVVMLGVQTTAGSWITHPPRPCARRSASVREY